MAAAVGELVTNNLFWNEKNVQFITFYFFIYLRNINQIEEFFFQEQLKKFSVNNLFWLFKAFDSLQSVLICSSFQIFQLVFIRRLIHWAFSLLPEVSLVLYASAALTTRKFSEHFVFFFFVLVLALLLF